MYNIYIFKCTRVKNDVGRVNDDKINKGVDEWFMPLSRWYPHQHRLLVTSQTPQTQNRRQHLPLDLPHCKGVWCVWCVYVTRGGAKHHVHCKN